MAVFDAALRTTIRTAGNIAVLVLDDPAKAVPLGRALHDGGVRVVELTLRTAAALDALRRMASELPGLVVGAGTVLTPRQVDEVAASGAAFAVAPGLNPRVVKAARDRGLSFAPGVMTPSEIEQAVELDCDLLKFFPAGVMGGLKGLNVLAAPYRHLGLTYIPLGGLTPETTGEYLKSPLVAACGGSWIATAELIGAADWGRIRENARVAATIAAAARG